MTPGVLPLCVAGVAGLALGSFAVTAGLRTSRGESVLSGRSHCDACGRPLGALQTLPVISYVGLAGACAGCRARIDPIHLAGEVAGALVVASSLWVADAARAAAMAVLGLALIASVTVDWKSRRLPDGLTATVAFLGLGLSVLRGGDAPLEGLAAAAIIVVLLLALRWLGQWRRGEPGLGMGDVKLMGALALWLGLATPWFVAAAAVAGLALMAVARPADGRLPFGPAIAAGAWIVGLGQELGAWPTMM